MAEKNIIDKVSHISSVSGGSLFVGLVFKYSDYQWPSQSKYLNHVYPKIYECLTNTSVQNSAIYKFFLNPINWRCILSRAQIIAMCIESLWGITETLEHLPQHPVWTINGTAAENGRRFRFKGTKIGDYKTGYADAKNYKLSVALAVSAAFPGGIGPVPLKTNKYQWRKRIHWDANQDQIVTPEIKKIHLYDGGVYDNLGIEPLFDIGRQVIKSDKKTDVNFVIVSDAGAPYKEQSMPSQFNLMRLKRVADVAFDQCRALRVRSYVNFLQNNSDAGMYFQIGFNPVEHISKSARAITNYRWLNSNNILAATQYPTTLKKMSQHDFENLARHGYETAHGNEISYLKVKEK